ncbi:epoxide hydrolase 1-like [Oppia nitens]|uniref:epoxide hydrolase 1-like n=1 Tax=Oppia nitens TaxID=1686743 RepID=UPI0023DBA662|nr:epoxide hydrolase 1-like [Oppia nitens]
MKIYAGQLLPKDPETINKFTVNISDAVLNDLKNRLESARYVQPLSDSQFSYGFNGDYLKQVVDYWLTKFDWRKQEKELNKFNHFKTQINGIDIHFIHVKPSKPAKTVVPLLAIHGWPGSVLEYYKALPMLIEPTNDIAFEVILPSIPGYGFSEAPHQPGFSIISAANIFVKLMKRLGYNQFFVHGGDWGSYISKVIAQTYPQNVIGLHTTLQQQQFDGMAGLKIMIGAYFPRLIYAEPDKAIEKLYPIKEKLYNGLRESGYAHIQATKPDTVGSALVDSPVGLAAYILEKFSTWTDLNNVHKPDGGLTKKFTLDQLLTNVMIYWVTGNVASSMRFYKETVPILFTTDINRIPVSASVPAAVADFPSELGRLPIELARYQYENLVQYTDMPRGGHFAAFEEPKLVVDDIKKFAKTVLELNQIRK